MESKTIGDPISATPLACSSLPLNDLALLGLQEVMQCRWLNIHALGLISMLSSRARQLASDGKYWRFAVRATFPYHPFEVNTDVW